MEKKIYISMIEFPDGIVEPLKAFFSQEEAEMYIIDLENENVEDDPDFEATYYVEDTILESNFE